MIAFSPKCAGYSNSYWNISMVYVNNNDYIYYNKITNNWGWVKKIRAICSNSDNNLVVKQNVID